MYTCTKRFANFPAAHRQHNHDGHCAYIHGHNWDFEITFLASELDDNLFVVDFGKLGFVKDFLTKTFDHTLLLNADDPDRGFLTSALKPPGSRPFADIVIVPNCGAEALAAFVCSEINSRLLTFSELVSREVRVLSVTVYEDSKNSATYHNA